MDSPDELTERMRNDQVDAVFARTSIAKPEGVVIDTLLREAMVVALPSGHALARRKGGKDATIPWKALANETFILVASPPAVLPIRNNLEVAACQTAGFNPRIGHIVANNISRLAFVAVGLGVALVSASMQRVNIDGVVFRHLKGAPQPQVPFNLATRRGDASVVVRNSLKSAKRTAMNVRAI
jgi:DNA-binding transcriptional LysR family regulator